MSTHPYDRARRAEASRTGWKWRRVNSVLTPYQIAHRRFDAAVRALDPVTLRLYACGVAEAVLPIYQTYRPDEGRPALALELGRRYARGQADEEERLLVFRLLGLACEQATTWKREYPEAGAALESAAFLTWKRVDGAVRWAIHYASAAHGHTWDDEATADLHRHCAALEALATSERKG